MLISKEHACPAEVKGTFLRPESSVKGSVLDSFIADLESAPAIEPKHIARPMS